jgi:hypothetical protein
MDIYNVETGEKVASNIPTIDIEADGEEIDFLQPKESIMTFTCKTTDEFLNSLKEINLETLKEFELGNSAGKKYKYFREDICIKKVFKNKNKKEYGSISEIKKLREENEFLRKSAEVLKQKTELLEKKDMVIKALYGEIQLLKKEKEELEVLLHDEKILQERKQNS